MSQPPRSVKIADNERGGWSSDRPRRPGEPERPPRKQERYHRGDKLRDCARRNRFRDNSIDMGTGYDCFDPKSHPFAASVTRKQRRNRLRLRRAMLAEGFKGLSTEWWHFTLRDEPFPETFFDFPVARSSVSG